MKGLILFLMLCLAGCATTDDPRFMRDDLEPKHLAWSTKTQAYADENTDVSVTMNEWGLLYLYVDGKIVSQRHNWCVEIVEYQPKEGDK